MLRHWPDLAASVQMLQNRWDRVTLGHHRGFYSEAKDASGNISVQGFALMHASSAHSLGGEIARAVRVTLIFC